MTEYLLSDVIQRMMELKAVGAEYVLDMTNPQGYKLACAVDGVLELAPTVLEMPELSAATAALNEATLGEIMNVKAPGLTVNHEASLLQFKQGGYELNESTTALLVDLLTGDLG